MKPESKTALKKFSVIMVASTLAVVLFNLAVINLVGSDQALEEFLLTMGAVALLIAYGMGFSMLPRKDQYSSVGHVDEGLERYL